MQTCAFCDNKADSKEHWPPKWTQGIIDFAENQNHTVSLGTDVALTGSGHQKGARAKTIKCVCRQCNNGWMSLVNDDAKNIILNLNINPGRLLSVKEQDKLSRWVILMTMIIEFSDFNTMSCDQLERVQFKNLGDDYGFWVVSIACIPHLTNCSFNHIVWNSNLKLRNISDDRIHIFDNQITIFEMGRLVLFSMKIKNLHNVDDYVAKLKDAGSLVICPSLPGASCLDRIYSGRPEMDAAMRTILPKDLSFNVRSQWETVDSGQSGRHRMPEDFITPSNTVKSFGNQRNHYSIIEYAPRHFNLFKRYNIVLLLPNTSPSPLSRIVDAHFYEISTSTG